MSSVPLSTVIRPTLGDVLDEWLSAALSMHAGPCLWCGGASVRVLQADPWSGQVVARCQSCGSELSGVASRRLREAS